jgi:hypothetical protein
MRFDPRISAFILLTTLWFSAGSTFAEDRGPAFKPLSVVSPDGISYEVSVDEKKYAVITYSGLGVAVMAGSDNPATPESVTRVASLVLPVSGADAGIKIGVNAEGYVSLDDHVDASLIVTANGQPQVLDFKGMKATDDILISGPCADTSEGRAQGANKTPVTRQAPQQAKTAIDASFMHCFVVDLPSITDLRLNFILNLSRRDRQGVGTFNVSTVHINVLNRQ